MSDLSCNNECTIERFVEELKKIYTMKNTITVGKPAEI
jgi:hypothetical protein